ncbi:MAG: ATP-dependent DNA helicase RecG [Gammaproteobacteria bacterium]|nr:ATP-dependent DNA helicase RecG [Gammaproteobacteria bacterium]
MDIQSQPLTVLKGVGPRVADKLKKMNLHTVQDVLFHLPFRYQDRTRIQAIGALQPGDQAVIVGKIEVADVVFRRKRNLVCRVSDGTGFITLRFFHFSVAQQTRLQRGNTLQCYGEVRKGQAGLEMVHPEYEVYEGEVEIKAEEELTPVYPTTEGVHQIGIRKLAQQALDHYLEKIHEWLPPEVLAEINLPPLKDAVHGVHRPLSSRDATLLQQGQHPSQQRLAFEELLAHQLSMQQKRAQNQQHRAPDLTAPGRLHKKLLAHLPFSLTGAQQRVIEEVQQDLTHAFPMQRLVQGDVGSGKTLIAAAAAAQAIEAGYQVAVMAPTELLVEQHAQNFQRWFKPLGIDVVLLTGSQAKKFRQSVLDVIASGERKLIIGTHALFQEDVVFHKLGLMIVDEQHRFGVNQRLALREKGGGDNTYPHQLVMTATPIPRTLAQTIYADLNVSVVDELPPGRKPVTTVVIGDNRRAEVVQRVEHACQQGRQAYWVCPLIEESETLQLQTATDTEAALKEALPQLNIGLVHGRMKAADKEKAMARFKRGELDLLVATTVIEVGVDVPNATLMIIENAERLGLSQLHQLRGRVGRGHEDSVCVLMYQTLSELARKRLAVMRETNDGFEVARQDLELRGPGELLGIRQTGMPQFHIADLMRDQALLPAVQKTAGLLQTKYPEHIAPLIRRWVQREQDYGSV